MAFLAGKGGSLSERAPTPGEVILRELDVSVPLSSLSVTGLDEFRYVRQGARARCTRAPSGSFVTGGDTGRLVRVLASARPCASAPGASPLKPSPRTSRRST